MAMTLSSKTFEIPHDKVVSWDFEDVRTFLTENILNNPDKADRRVVITIQTAGNFRQKKYLARAQLLELVTVDTGSKTVWLCGEYKFDFRLNTYIWNDKEIYITAGEALYLFYELVLKEPCKAKQFFLKNLRKKFGRHFLEGII